MAGETATPAPETTSNASQSESDEQSAETTTDMSSPKKSKSLMKIVLIVLGLLALCCILCIVLFALFGHLESDGECKYRGPFAQESEFCKDEDKDNNENTTDEDVTTDDSSTDELLGDFNDTNTDVVVPTGSTKYEGLFYNFVYPNTWAADESSNGVTLTGPNGADNFIVTEITDNSFVPSSSDCSDYADGLLQGLKTQYDSVTLISDDYTAVDGNGTCRVELEGTLLGVTLQQVQYYVLDESYEDFAYILTLTAQKGSSGLGQMEDMVDSFQVE